MVKRQNRYKQVLLIILAICAGACKKIAMPDETPLLISDAQSVSIKKLRSLGTSTAVTLPNSLQINGVVISDATGKNIDSRSIVLQGLLTDTSGIIVSFDTIPGFRTGDNLTINAGGLSLRQQNGELVLSGVSLSKVTKTLGGININPRQASVKEVLTNAASWNGTLVSFHEGAFSGSGGKYDGIIHFRETDSASTVKFSILPGATFEGAVYPTSLSGVTGIIRMNGTEPYIEIRNMDDVSNAAVTRYEVEDMSGFSTGRQYSVFSSPGFFSSGMLETKTKMYSTSANLGGYIKPFREDADFLSSKSWLYFFDGYSPWAGALLSVGGSNLKGIKAFRITFAASKVTGFITSDQYGNNYNIIPFDPLNDKIQLKLNGSREDTSAAFNEPGRFYTVTFHIPTRSELIKAAMTQYGDDWPNYAAYTIQQIDQQIAIPQLALMNVSTRLNDPEGGFAPVIISKIEYGF